MLKRLLDRALRMQGKEIASVDELGFYRNLDSRVLLYGELPQKGKELIAPWLPHAKSQLGQDLFALAFADTLSPRFFVEFGATDGVSLSNTWLLEKKLGWNGILAEPARTWHDSLRRNRSCSIEMNCVAKESGRKLQFLEVDDKSGGSAVLSGIEEFADNGDWASGIRKSSSQRYEVETISLNDLLDKHNAPGDIQFLSLDTEGSELDILSGYNFGSRKIRSICVEHNHVQAIRASIHELLVANGYKRVFARVSRWDDWYVLEHG